MTMPIECAAGVDALDLRRRFGKDLLLMGNISRQEIMDGRKAIEKEARPQRLLLNYPVRLALNPFVSGIGALFPQLISGGAIVGIHAHGLAVVA